MPDYYAEEDYADGQRRLQEHPPKCPACGLTCCIEGFCCDGIGCVPKDEAHDGKSSE